MAPPSPAPAPAWDHQDNILYELLVHAEWPLEPEVHGGGAISLGGNFFYRTLTQTPANIWALASSLWAYLTSASTLSPSLAKLVGGRCGWQLGVGAQGAVVVVVQAASLEIRAKKDEFASVVGRNTNLYVDPFPSWRRVAWSADCSMVGLAYSSGAVEVFNTLGHSIFTIYPPRYREGAPQMDTSKALSALVFSDIRTQKIKWAAELLLVDYKGYVRSYLVSPTEGYQESHTFSLGKVYPGGITAATNYRDLLVVAGSCVYMNDNTLKKNGLGHGITLWRMLNDYPFYKQVATIDEDEYLPPSVGLMGHLAGRWSPPHHDCVFHLSVSPSHHQLAALHTSGSLSIWELPSLRKKKFWQIPDQPDHDAKNPALGEFVHPRQRPGQSFGPPRGHPAELAWWSEAAVIVARYSGSVTVSSVASLRNLLGESPEFLDGVPQISEAYDRAFLSLEVEGCSINKRFFSSFSEGRREEEGAEEEYPEDDEDEEEQEDEEESSIILRSRRLARSVLYWVTDAERFRPHSRRPKIVQKIFRLLCLKSTTPEELFARKIENEEYGEALALARSYGLDCDRVYQQQWRRSSVTVATIQDYLAKIRKRAWVLAECLGRVPDDLDAARELLLYGLRGTDLETVLAIGEGRDEGEFIWSSGSSSGGGSDEEYEDGLDVPMGEYQARVQERAARELKRRHQMLSKIDFSKLTSEQKTVIQARQKLLSYLDRLATYEVLLGGAHLAPEHYDASFYDKFRCQSAISATVEFARSGDWRGVDVMFTYHGQETLPNHLAVLSNFPPTLGPYEYRSLLPECKGDNVFPWEEEQLRDEDWCEEPACRAAVVQDEGDPADFLYQERPALEEFKGVEGEVGSALVGKWYRERAKEVERCSHFVDVALDLLKLGRERGVEGLEDLLDELETLEVMVYEVGLSSMTLDKLSDLTDQEKVTQLMSTSTPETYIQNIRRWLLPFLARCEKGHPGQSNTLLRSYMVSTAKIDLGLPLKILQHSRPDQHSPIITSSEEMMAVAVECVYACERESQLPWAIACLECLPERESRSSESLCRLHDLADALDAHLNAAELLSNNGVNVTPRHLKEMQGDATRVKEVLIRLTRAAAKRTPRLSDEEWRRLLYDTLELQQKVFTCVEPQVCFQKVTEALLCSGLSENIRLAGELMETRADHSPVNNPYLQQLPFHHAVQLVITAATQYYNSSESHTDQAIDLAIQCLNLIDSEHEDIQREKDLIAALQILPDFGIQKLPLQVRLCEDRLALVGECLAAKRSAHRHSSLLQHLAGLLRVCGEDARARQGKVLTLVAQAALEAGDYIVASSLCEQIVGGEHQEGWVVCEALGKTKHFANLIARARFLDFALTHATASHLEDLLNARNEVELATLYARVNQQIEQQQQDTTGDSDEAFVDAQDEQLDDDEEEEEEEEEEDEEDEFYDGQEGGEEGDTGGVRRRSLLRGTLGMTRSVLSATASTTSTIVSTVASRQLWRSALNWMQPLMKLSTQAEECQQLEDTNADFLRQGCHAFYADIIPDPHISAVGASYKSYASCQTCAPLEFSLALLRIALLEETLSLGTSIKANKTVVSEAARGLLREDMALGLLLLLALREAEGAKEVLATLPRTDISLQVCQYYYALQVYTRLHPWHQPQIAPVFLHDPAAVIACVSHTIGTTSISEFSEDVRPFVELFRAMLCLVEDYSQGQALQRLGAGVDIERFLSDGSYKEDTVLGLAMTLDEEVLTLALTLARRYSVSLWQVYMTHLQHIFDADLSTEEVRQCLAAGDLLNTLTERPQEFVSSMQQRVFPTIDGCDHDRLLLFYSLLEPCEASATTPTMATSHIKLLKKLKGSANGLNYKLLLRPDSDPLEVLRPVLTTSNVNSLAKAARNVPCRQGAGLEPSTVYCAWAQKYFFDIPDKKPKTTSDWVHRYEACGEYLQKMTAPDVLRFIRQVVLSDTAANMVPVEARSEMIRRVLKHCKQQQSRQKLAEDGRVWEEAAGSMNRWGDHLELLRSSCFLQLWQSADERLREYARRFAQTGGDTEGLQDVACAVLMEGCDLGVLREVLAVFPGGAEAATSEDVIMETLRRLLEGWRTGGGQVKLAGGRNQVDALNHLLGQVGAYLEEGGELLAEEEVLEEVRRLCSDAGVPLEARVQVLTVAEKHLTMSEEDLQLVRVMRTGGVVEGAWPGQVVEQEQLATSESRAALLASLVSLTSSTPQAHALLRLLDLWPLFDTKEYESATTNPWLRVFFKTLEVTQDDPTAGLKVIWEAARQAHHLNQVSEESLMALVKQLQGLGRVGLLCCCKVALLSAEPQVHAVVLESLTGLQEVRESDYDGELLCEVVKQGLVAPLLATPLYGPLVFHLVESRDREMIRSAVGQLKDAGHHREAASLASANSSLPKALQTMTSLLRTYDKWL